MVKLTCVVAEATDGPDDLQTLAVENPNFLIAARDVEESLISVR